MNRNVPAGGRGGYHSACVLSDGMRKYNAALAHPLVTTKTASR